jgi:signal transduction histidine kinase
VEDRGPGLSPHDAARVFQPFYRSDAARSRRIPGAGLGLAVVARIAQVLHGTAHVATPRTPGCRIEIHLPLAAGAIVNRPLEFPEPIDTRPWTWT